MNQKEAFELFSPLIEQRGKIYFKCSLVYVVCAKEGDYIETWTADGLETTNYANEGDFIVQNIQTEAQEKYIVTPNATKIFERIFNSENNSKLYPVAVSVSSYDQATNNVREWVTPDNGTCSPASMCGALYDAKEPAEQKVPEPLPFDIPDKRVGYYASTRL